MPVPEGKSGIIDALEADRLMRRDDAGGWGVTNLGAVLFARDLDAFAGLRRKAVRVIQYRGDARFDTVREQVGAMGYARGFEGLIGFVNQLLPSNEVIGEALRRTVPMYPELAVRELVANALIHQDLTIRGAGPMVEIFADRMEITNPGLPLIHPDRFLDTPPHSRNEALAALMRRVGVCEERGSGIDKVVAQVEFYALPAPLFETLDSSAGGSTKVTLFAHAELNDMDSDARIRACYQHACLQRVSHKFLTNASLRKRFGIERQNASKASRLIREAMDAGRIRPHDASASRKNMKYVPFWVGEVV